jgi:hypothetical protein
VYSIASITFSQAVRVGAAGRTGTRCRHAARRHAASADSPAAIGPAGTQWFRGRTVQPGDEIEQGRFARAGLAQDGDELPRRNIEIDRLQGVQRLPRAANVRETPRSEMTGAVAWEDAFIGIIPCRRRRAPAA